MYFICDFPALVWLTWFWKWQSKCQILPKSSVALFSGSPAWIVKNSNELRRTFEFRFFWFPWCRCYSQITTRCVRHIQQTLRDCAGLSPIKCFCTCFCPAPDFPLTKVWRRLGGAKRLWISRIMGRLPFYRHWLLHCIILNALHIKPIIDERSVCFCITSNSLCSSFGSTYLRLVI